MQIYNNNLRTQKRALPETTLDRIEKIKELFKNARTMAEKEAAAKMLSKKSLI